jgi:diguanylate cyclase (GGDEF)-like protein
MLPIRSWLIFLAVAASLPLVLFSGFMVYQSGKYQQQATTWSLLERGQAGANATKQRIDAVVAALKILSVSKSAREGEWERLYLNAAAILPEFPYALAIALVTADGQVVFNTARPFGSKDLPRAGAIESVRRAFDSGEPTVSGLFKGLITPELLLAVNVPVSDADKVSYCLRMTLRTKVLGDLLREQSLPKEWTATIVDSTGTIAARTRNADKFVGGKASPTLLQALAEKPEGLIDTVTLEGVATKTAIFSLAPWGLSLAIGLPENALTQPLVHTLQAVVLGGACLLGIAVGLAVVLARMLTRQATLLTEAASSLAAGGRPSVKRTIVREVHDALKNMESAASRELRTNSQLSEALTASEELRRLSITDGLTGIANRREFDHVLEREWRRCARQGASLAVIMVDVDHFKAFNDLYGHQAGDNCLAAVAGALTRSVRRPGDLIARYGGEEFAAILPDISLDGAMTVAQRMLDSVRAKMIPHDRSSAGPIVTISLGVSASTPLAGSSLEQLLAETDACLYEAKKTGRNAIRARSVAA